MSVLLMKPQSTNTAQGFTLIEVMVAMSLLALGVAGLVQLRHAAYRHIAVTQEIQQASYFAESHLNKLSTDNSVKSGYQTGEYSRGQGAQPYRWELNLVQLSNDALQPQSAALSEKVRALQLSLFVWVDDDKRKLSFHTLILAAPSVSQASSKPSFTLRDIND